MNLPPLEGHVFAYFLTHGARDFTMSGRWFPYGKLTLMLDAKVKVTCRPFGKAALAALEASDPIIQQARGSGPDFGENAFAGLV